MRTSLHIITLFTALLLAPFAASHAADAPKRANKPNLLILLADDMGDNDPGCCNPKSKIAPLPPLPLQASALELRRRACRSETGCRGFDVFRTPRHSTADVLVLVIGKSLE